MKTTYTIKNFAIRIIAILVFLTTSSIANVWSAVTSPITLTTNGTTLGYSTGTATLTDKFDYKLTFSSVTSGSSDGYIQNAKSSEIYNTVAIPGAITSIKLTDCATTSIKTDGGFTMYGGTTLANCTTSVGSATGLSSTAADKTITFTESDNYTFFKIVNGADRVLKISSIVISFSTGGGSGVDLTFSVPSGVTQPDTQKSSVSLPTPTGSPTNCGDCWVFAGWTTSTNSSYSGSSAPDPLYAAGTTQSFASATTLYAVYKKEEYEAITSTSGLVANDYYVIVSQSGSVRQALSNTAHATFDTDAAATNVSSYAKEDAEGFYLYNVPSDVTWKFTGTYSSGQLQNVKNTSIYLNLSSQSASILNSTNNLTFAVSGYQWTISSTYYLGGYTYSSTYGFDAASSDDFANSRYHPYLYHRTSAAYATSPGCSSYDIVWMNNGSTYSTGSPTETTNLCEGIETLPTPPADNSLSECANVFMGWSETSSSVGGSAPSDLFVHALDAPKIDEDKTFYAVYVSMDSLTPTKTQTLQYDTWKYGGTTTTDKTTYRLFGDGSYIVSEAFDLRTLAKVVVYGGTYGGDGYNSITIGDGTNTWKSVTVSGNKETGTNEYTGGSTLRGMGYLYIESNSGNGTGNGVRISKVEIYTYPVENYCTSCCEKRSISLSGTPAGTVSGGTFSADPSSACAGTTITLTNTPASGYNFSSWTVTGATSGDDVTVTSNQFTMPNEAVTVTAAFETAHTTTVTLNAQGGSGGTDEVTATVNLPMPSATMPTRSGYTFGGFYGASGGSGTQYYAADGSSANNWDNGVDDAVTIYAKWTASGYTVTLNNMSATTGGTSSVSVTYGASTNLTTAITCPTKTNKVFGGYWTSANSGATLDTKLIDEDGNWLPSVSGYTNANKQWQYANDLTLYAKWSDVSYTNYRTTCGPEITVSGGPVYLTSYANCEVLTTGNITVSSTAWGSTVGAPKYLRFSLKDKIGGTKYVHSSSNISSSEFRVYNSADNGGSYADGSDFAIPTGTTGSASYTFRIAYKPAASVYNTRDHYVLEVEVMDNQSPKKALTMETVELYGRTLPEEFAIAVKKDDQWYALPNDLASTSATAKAVSGIPIVVDNSTTPTSALYAPENALYKATSYYTGPAVASRNRSGVRFTRNGSQYLQVSTTAATNTMWLSTTGGADVQDWYLNSKTFNAYTVKIDPRAGTGGYKDKKMGMSSNGNFGFYASPTSADIYFLPVEGELKEASVVEWGKNSLIVEADAGTYSKVIARVGSTATGALTLTQTRTSVKGSTTAYNYTVNLGTAIDLSTKKGQILYLDWLDGSGDVKGASMVTIPWIIAANSVMGEIDNVQAHWKDWEVHVLPGYTLEADGTSFSAASNVAKIKTLEIYPGATVKVTSGTLDVTNLVLRNGWTRANGKSYDVARLYIDASANMAKPSNAYADWYIDFDQYYPIAVPWEVDLGENDGSKLNYLNTNSAAIIGEGSLTSVRLRYYDGESRATNGQTGVGSSANWKLYGGDDNDDVPSKLVPGKGYAMTAKRPTGKAFSIIRMPLSIPLADWTTGGEKGVVSSTHKDQVTVKAWGVSDESKPRYIVGWNFIANPYMAIYQGAITHSEGSTYDIEHVNIPDIDFKEFGQYAVGALGQKLLPASGFLIQAEKDGTLTFGASNRKASAPSYRNETAQVYTKQKAYITLDGADAEDMMGLLISERYTADYDINGDLQKLLSDGNTLRAWMNYISMNLAYVAVNEELAKEWIPVSVRIPEAGEYTFRMHEASIADELEGVYLIDYQTDVTTNLMYDSYTFTAEAGTNTKRFAINAIVGERKVPTSMDVTGGDVNGNEPVKFIWHDKVYILHNNVIYDSTGKRVNVINK